MEDKGIFASIRDAFNISVFGKKEAEASAAAHSNEGDDKQN